MGNQGFLAAVQWGPRLIRVIFTLTEGDQDFFAFRMKKAPANFKIDKILTFLTKKNLIMKVNIILEDCQLLQMLFKIAI